MAPFLNRVMKLVTVEKKISHSFSVLGFEMHLIRCWFGLDVGHWTQSYKVWQHV